MAGGEFDEQHRRAQLFQPELRLPRTRIRPVLQVVSFDEPTQHRPVLVALGLLGLHQIGQRQQVVFVAIRRLDGRAPHPQDIEGLHAAHGRHDVDPHACRIRMTTAKVQGMAATQIFHLERRQRDRLGVETSQRRAKALEVAGGRQDGEVGVATKFRRAVEHARLAAHQQALDAMCPHRRKDFAYRARRQACLPAPGTSARAPGCGPTVAAASVDTIPPTHRRRFARPLPWGLRIAHPSGHNRGVTGAR
jgi:hypothetical protein